jgi:hypothetical protein
MEGPFLSNMEYTIFLITKMFIVKKTKYLKGG